MSNTETNFWESITRLGQLPWIIVLLAICTIPTLAHNDRIYTSYISAGTLGNDVWPLIIGWLGIFFSYWGGTIIKALYHKPRPVPRNTSTLWKKINAGSMPSIHASNSLICGFTFVLNWTSYPLMNNIMVQFYCVLIIGLVIFMSISLSRIALHKHYPIDVLAGSIFGSMIISILSVNSSSIIALLDRAIALFI